MMGRQQLVGRSPTFNLCVRRHFVGSRCSRLAHLAQQCFNRAPIAAYFPFLSLSAGGCATDMTMPKNARPWQNVCHTVAFVRFRFDQCRLVAPFRVAARIGRVQRVCMIGPSETHTLAQGNGCGAMQTTSALKSHLVAWQNLHRLIISMDRGMFRRMGELVPVVG